MAIQLLKQEMFHNYNVYVHCKWRFRNKYRYLYLYKVISPPPSAKKYISITVSENLNTMDINILYTITIACIMTWRSDTVVYMLHVSYLAILIWDSFDATPPPLKMAFYLDVKYVHFTLAYIYSDVLNTST